MLYELPTNARFETTCSMAEADGARRQIVGLIPDADGKFTTWTALDNHGTRHDVPMLDEASGNYPAGDRQAFRVATYVIRHHNYAVQPCCC